MKCEGAGCTCRAPRGGRGGRGQDSVNEVGSQRHGSCVLCLSSDEVGVAILEEVWRPASWEIPNMVGTHAY